MVSLNGGNSKILGVYWHHDLGTLGAAFNTSAETPAENFKEMGVNAYGWPTTGWAKRKISLIIILILQSGIKGPGEHMVRRGRNHLLISCGA